MARRKQTAEEREARRDGTREKYERKFTDAEALKAAIDAYFAGCDARGELYDEAGLCLHLGVSLSTLRSWRSAARMPEFQFLVQMADLRIQHQLATHPVYMEKAAASKSMFLLKQQQFGGYQDRIEAKQDLTVNVRMGQGMDETDFG